MRMGSELYASRFYQPGGLPSHTDPDALCLKGDP